MFKRLFVTVFAMAVLCVTGQAYAVGFEIAAGSWLQNFGGTLGYEIIDSGDILDIDNDFDFEDKHQFIGRIKVELPAFIPNIYVVAAPIDFDATGSKSVEVTYGDITATANAELESEISINQYDVALYWSVPGVKLATADTLNIDIGVNIRLVDLSAKLTASDTVSGGSGEEEVSVTAPIPMAYVALQIMPFDIFAIEMEGRGIAIGDNRLFSLIGRLRFQVAEPLFIAAGYRTDNLEIDEDDVQADIEFSGPFIEVGLKF